MPKMRKVSILVLVVTLMIVLSLYEVYMSQTQKLGYRIDKMVSAWLLEMTGW